MSDLKAAAQQALEFCEFLWREVAMNDYAEEQRERVEAALRAALEAQEEHDTDCHAQGICQRSGYNIGAQWRQDTIRELERFASLVAAAEREEAQRALDHQAWGFRCFLLAQHEQYKDRCNYFLVALEEFKRAEEVAKLANEVRQKESPPV